MFLFAATGGRAAMAGRERAFVYGLVRACEVLVFLISGCYLLGFNMFGNPNNLGAFIGVLALPVLLWGGLMAENRRQRQRCYLALGLCGILLYVSVCRAAIMADVILVIGLTIGLRRPRMLVRAAFAGALLLELMAVANPGHMGEFVDTLTGRFLFKTGQTHTGVFGSRQSPWDDTVAAMKRHPWFGTGFGTSDVGQLDANVQTSSIYTKEGSNREHGSSYLAMAEYMGILGILPFLLLLAILARSVARVYAWMRNTGSPAHYSVPLALVTAAGLIHAGFEDWLVAPGSYLCLAFWVCAFLLIDMAPKPGPAFRAAMRPAAGAPQPLRQSTTPV
jgi:O-antigen ligase